MRKNERLVKPLTSIFIVESKVNQSITITKSEKPEWINNYIHGGFQRTGVPNVVYCPNTNLYLCENVESAKLQANIIKQTWMISLQNTLEIVEAIKF